MRRRRKRSDALLTAVQEPGVAALKSPSPELSVQRAVSVGMITAGGTGLHDAAVCSEQNGRAIDSMVENSKGDSHQPQVRAHTAPRETLPESAASRLCIVAV